VSEIRLQEGVLARRLVQRHRPRQQHGKQPMGFTYRKSVSIGPFRVNVGRSGVGYSVGGKGFRTGVSSQGKRYSTFSVPGTGLGYRTEHKGRGCLLVAAGLIAVTILLMEGLR